MIAYLAGIVRHITADELILDAGGVGYVAACPKPLLAKAEQGQAYTVWVFSVMRESQMTLYGFDSFSERELFAILIGVGGVGGRVALSLLSKLGSAGVLRALEQQNKEALAQADGVGPRLAARVLLELKPKTAAIAALFAGQEEGAVSGVSHEAAPEGFQENAFAQDVLQALKQLGYTAQEVMPFLRAALDALPDAPAFEDILRHTLQRLGAKGVG